MSKENMMLDRRTFAKASGALGALAVAGGACGATFAQTTPVAFADEAASTDEIVWTHCHVNCGGAARPSSATSRRAPACADARSANG